MNPFDNLVNRLTFLEAKGKPSFVAKYPALADIPSRIKDYNAQLVRQKMGIKDDTKLKIEVSGLPYKVIRVVSRLLYRVDIISDEEMDGLTKSYGIAAKIRYLDGLIRQYNADLQPGQPGKERLDAFINQGGLDRVVEETFGTKKETTMAGEVAQAEQKQATKDAVEQVFDELTPGEEETLLTRVMFATVLKTIENDDELIEDIADDANTSMPEVRKIIDMLIKRSAKINTVDDIVKITRKLVAIPGMQKIAAMIKGSIIDVIPSEIERVQSLGGDTEVPDETYERGADLSLDDIDFLDDDYEPESPESAIEKLKTTISNSPEKKAPTSDLSLDDIIFMDDDEEDISMDDVMQKLKRSHLRENKYVSFKEKYKPTTSWQLNELRGYGL
jgi:predicted transcriptional regulator